MGPELITAVGGALAAAVTAFFGGKNSLNGFKTRVDARFDSVERRFDHVDGKIDSLIANDAVQNVRLDKDERTLEDLEKRTTTLELDPQEETH